MEWMKLNFPSNLKCHSYIFCIPKTKMERIKFTRHSYMFYTPKTQNGMDET